MHAKIEQGKNNDIVQRSSSTETKNTNKRTLSCCSSFKYLAANRTTRCKTRARTTWRERENVHFVLPAWGGDYHLCSHFASTAASSRAPPRWAPRPSSQQEFGSPSNRFDRSTFFRVLRLCCKTRVVPRNLRASSITSKQRQQQREQHQQLIGMCLVLSWYIIDVTADTA